MTGQMVGTRRGDRTKGRYEKGRQDKRSVREGVTGQKVGMRRGDRTEGRYGKW